MSMQWTDRRRPAGLLALLVAAAVAFGCGGAAEDSSDSAAAAPATTPAQSEPAAPAGETAAAVEAVLAKADALDGAQDHVVSKCPGCAMMMDGHADHALEVGEYSLHFCSDECRDRFGENAEEAVLALRLPERAP